MQLLTMTVIHFLDCNSKQKFIAKAPIIKHGFSYMHIAVHSLGLQAQVTADKKHVVLQSLHCLSSSGSNSNASRSASVVPCTWDTQQCEKNIIPDGKAYLVCKSIKENSKVD